MADLAQFVRAVQSADSQPDAVAAIQLLLADCVKEIGADTGSLHLLRLNQSAFSIVGSVNDPPTAISISTSVLDHSKPPSSLLEEVLISGRTHRVAPDEANADLCVPIIRGRTPLGAIFLRKPLVLGFSQLDVEFAEIVAAMSILLYEKDNSRRLLHALPKPIDFKVPWSDFVDELMLLASDASGMPYLILRERHQNSLNCLGSFGFTIDSDEDLNIDPLDEWEAFAEVVNSGKRRSFPDMNLDAGVSRLRERSPLSVLRSFALIPVKVGSEVFGTLSFAATCRYEYTSLELDGFESIANAIGVAITNFRNFNEVNDATEKQLELGFKMTAVELAQAARHEAKNSLEVMKLSLNTLKLLFPPGQTPQRRAIDLAQQHFKESSDNLTAIMQSLDRIKTATTPPRRAQSSIQLVEVIKESKELSQARLNIYDIAVRVSGDLNVTIPAFPEWLRHAFANLFLNSVEAFASKSAKGRGRQREIVVRIEDLGEKANDILVRYSDNATGIDPSRLNVPLDEGQTIADIIFNAGVTGKPEGSGYGLYLVRNIISDHQGSIELREYRGRTTFDIRLPKVWS